MTKSSDVFIRKSKKEEACNNLLGNLLFRYFYLNKLACIFNCFFKQKLSLNSFYSNKVFIICMINPQ